MILFFIIMASIIIALDSPLYDPNSTYRRTLTYIDMAISGIFVIEVILKWMAYGIIFNGKKSYFRNKWNIIDYLVIVFSVRIIYLFYLIDSLLCDTSDQFKHH